MQQKFTKNFGSLQQFIDLPSQRTLITQHQISLSNRITRGITQNEYMQKKQDRFWNSANKRSDQIKQIQLRSAQKRRVKTVLDQYQPKKKYMKHLTSSQESINLQSQYEDMLQKKVSLNSSININNPCNVTKTSISYRGNIFPKKDRMFELLIKKRPRPQETLLRAIDKYQQKEKPKIKEILSHQKSLDSLISNLQNADKKPINEQAAVYKPPQVNYKNREQFYQKRRTQIIRNVLQHENLKIGRKISSMKRIQFEQCLSWAKKHHKNGSYYEKSLGKNQDSQKIEDTYRKRKDIMKQLYNKHVPKRHQSLSRTITQRQPL